MAVAIVALLVIAAAMARRQDIEAGREFWKPYEPWMLGFIVVIVGWAIIAEVAKP